jgi:hypothetical protein
MPRVRNLPPEKHALRAKQQAKIKAQQAKIQDQEDAEARRLRTEAAHLRARLELARRGDAIASKSVRPKSGEGEVAKFLRDIDRRGYEVVRTAMWLGCNAEEMAIAHRLVDTQLPRTSTRSIEPVEKERRPGG